MTEETGSSGGQQGGQSRREIMEENERLKAELADEKSRREAVESAVAAEKGPAQGTVICFQKHGESFCRPAVSASHGFTERVQRASGVELHALIEYGEPQWAKVENKKGELVTMGHTFQTDRPWNPLGTDETWHLPDECPRKGTSGCPYARAPESPQTA